MMKRMKKVGVFILAVAYVVGSCLCFLVGVALSAGHVDVEPSIARPDEIKYYDPKVGFEEANEDTSLDDIEYEMTFLQYDNHYKTAKPIENLNHEVTNDEEFYKVALRVKNNTAEELSGARFFIKLPDSIGEQAVVGDEITVTAQLEYDGAVAQRQLNLADKDSPIAVCFPSGSAGYIWKNNVEGEALPAYEDIGRSLLDYWQDEGFELNVPAGEEWQLYVSVYAEVVTDFQVKTRITSMDGEYSGRELSIATVFGMKKRFHVVTEIANPTNIEQPTEIQTYFDTGINLVSGSARLNGEQISNFVVQKDRHYTSSGTVDLGVNMPHKIMTLEYDIDVEPELKSKNARAVYVWSLVDVGAMSVSTVVGCRVFNATIAVALMMPAAINAIIAMVFSIYIVKRARHKHVE